MCILLKKLSHSFLPYVHPKVDYGIDHGIGHRHEIESKKDVLDVSVLCHLRIHVDHNEVGVVGKPAYCEY